MDYEWAHSHYILLTSDNRIETCDSYKVNAADGSLCLCLWGAAVALVIGDAIAEFEDVVAKDLKAY